MRPVLAVLLGVLALAGSGGATTAPAAARIVFASNRDGVDRLYSTVAQGGPVTRLAARDLGGGAAVVAARAGTVVFADRRSALYAVGADGRGLRRLGSGFLPALSTDGLPVAYRVVARGRTRLWTVAAVG